MFFVSKTITFSDHVLLVRNSSVINCFLTQIVFCSGRKFLSIVTDNYLRYNCGNTTCKSLTTQYRWNLWSNFSVRQSVNLLTRDGFVSLCYEDLHQAKFFVSTCEGGQSRHREQLRKRYPLSCCLAHQGRREPERQLYTTQLFSTHCSPKAVSRNTLHLTTTLTRLKIQPMVIPNHFTYDLNYQIN